MKPKLHVFYEDKTPSSSTTPTLSSPQISTMALQGDRGANDPLANTPPSKPSPASTTTSPIDQNNNYFSLNFDAADLCLLLDTNNANLQRKPRASESSTVFDTCSSNSSTTSTYNNNNNNIQLMNTSDYKPYNPVSMGDGCESSVVNEFVEDSQSSIKVTKYKTGKLKKLQAVTPRASAHEKRKAAVLSDGIDLHPVLEHYYTMVYTCMHPHCGMEMVLESDLLLHLEEKHDIQEPGDRETAASKFGKLSYKCIYDRQTCGKKLDTLNKIANHICKTHLSKTLVPFTNTAEKIIDPLSDNASVYFNNIFIFEKAFKMHKLKHKQLQQQQQDDSGKMEFGGQIEPKKNHCCQICNSRFVRPSHLKSHMKSHMKSGFKCDYCVEVFVKHSNLLSHVFEKHKQTEKIYKCHYEGCNKSYLCKMYLSSHITKSHLKQPPTDADKQCAECNLKFSTVWLKRQHDETEHNRKSEISRSYKCAHENCNKVFATSSKLHRHCITHVKVKQFRCDFEDCNAEFSRQDHLVNHTKFHGEERIYECDYPNCTSLFKYQNNLITHKKLHLTRDQVLSTVKEAENEPEIDLKRPRKHIYQEFKPIIQVSDEENHIQPDKTNYHGNKRHSICSVNEHLEIKCDSCLFTFNCEEDLDLHLKSHFDVNKANEKLNEYLVAEQRKDLVKHNVELEDDNVVEEEFSSSYIQTEQVFNGLELGQPDTRLECIDLNDDEQKYLVQMNNTDLNENDADMNVGLKYNHVININSDDEENVLCSVVVENLSGSARTDYKSNHIYIEKYRLKRKTAEALQPSNKRSKLTSETENMYDKPVSSHSSMSSVIFSPVSCTPESKKRATSTCTRKKPYKRRTTMQKSQSMSFQSDLSSLQESLIPQTSLQC